MGKTKTKVLREKRPHDQLMLPSMGSFCNLSKVISAENEKSNKGVRHHILS